MVVTVVLSGVPPNVSLEELARGLDYCLKSDEVGSFVARDLLLRSRTGKRQVALDFKTGFDAMMAQDILNGYEYVLPNKEYVLTAKVTKDPNYLPDAGTVDHLITPPAVYPNTLVPYNSNREEVERAQEDLDDQIVTLKKKLIIVNKKRKLLKAKKKLKKITKKRRRHSDSDSSDSEPRRKRKKRARSSRSTDSSLSPPPPRKHGSGFKRADSSGSSSSTDNDHRKRRRRLVGAEGPRCLRSKRASSESSVSSPDRKKLRPLPAAPSTELRSERPTRWDTLLRPSSIVLSSSRDFAMTTMSSANRRSPSRERSPKPSTSGRRSPPSHDTRRSPYRRHCPRTPLSPHRSRYSHSGVSPHSPSRNSPHSPNRISRHSPNKISPHSPSRNSRHSPNRISLHSHSRNSPHSHSNIAPHPHNSISSRRSPFKHSDIFTDLYKMMRSNKSVEQSSRACNSTIVLIDRQIKTCQSPPTPATVTEIHDDPDIWGQVDELPDLEDEEAAENRDSSPTADGPNINLTINVVKKKAQNLDAELERDKTRIEQFKTEIKKIVSPEKKKIESSEKKKKKMPLPMVCHDEIKKEIVPENTMTAEELRESMPKPIVQIGNALAKEHVTVKAEAEDQDVIIVSVDKLNQTISQNPKFVIPVTKILKQMRFQTNGIDENLKVKFLGIMRKILKMRIKDLLEGKDYMKSRSIVELYREHYDSKQDGELVANVVNAMTDGAFRDFVPSDDEDYQPGQEGQHDFIPYISGKKKSDNNKENIAEKNDDLVVLEKNVDVIDISDSEEAPNKTLDVKRVKTEEPEDINLNGSEYAEGTPRISSVNVLLEPDIHVKVETASSFVDVEDTITIDEDENSVVVKTENDAGISIKSEVDEDADTVDLSEQFTTMVNELELSTFVKMESDSDACNGTDTTAGEDSVLLLQNAEVVIQPEPSRENLINDILKISNKKIFSKSTPIETNVTDVSVHTMKDIDKETVSDKNDKIVSKNKTDVIKPPCQVSTNDAMVHETIATVEQASYANLDHLLETVVKTEVVEPEETVESIEKFVNLVTTTTIIDESNVDTDNNVNLDTNETNDEPNGENLQDVPSNVVKMEQIEPEESLESIEKYVNLVTNIIDIN